MACCWAVLDVLDTKTGHKVLLLDPRVQGNVFPLARCKGNWRRDCRAALIQSSSLLLVWWKPASDYGSARRDELNFSILAAFLACQLLLADETATRILLLLVRARQNHEMTKKESVFMASHGVLERNGNYCRIKHLNVLGETSCPLWIPVLSLTPKQCGKHGKSRNTFC